MYISDSFLKNVSTGIFADGGIVDTYIQVTTYPNLKCTVNITQQGQNGIIIEISIYSVWNRYHLRIFQQLPHQMVA